MNMNEKTALPEKKSYYDQEYLVSARRRSYNCPSCDSGQLVGYGVRPKTHQVTMNRYLAPTVSHKGRLTIDNQEVSFRSLGRLNLFICPKCYFMTDAPIVLKAGKIVTDRQMLSFAYKTQGQLQTDEGGLSVRQLFWICLRHYASKMTGNDWFALGVKHEVINPQVVNAFRTKAAQYNAYIQAMLQKKDLETSMQLLAKLESSTKQGLAELLTVDSYANLPVLSGLYLYRMIQYVILFGRDNAKPFMFDPNIDPLESILQYFESFKPGRPIDRAFCGYAMIIAARMIQVACSRKDSSLLHRIILITSELIGRGGIVNYNNMEVRPEIPQENYEVAGYLHLLAYHKVPSEDHPDLRQKDIARSELSFGLNRCAAYSRGDGNSIQLRACRLAEQVSKLALKNLPEGSVDLKEISIA